MKWVVATFVASALYALSPEESAFILPIQRDSSDFVTRLVYADWLDERGETDRAAFIRKSCQLENLKALFPRFEYHALEDEVDALLREHWDEWLPAGLSSRLGREGSYVRWRGGFTEGITLSEADLRDPAFRAGIDALPVLHEIRVQTFREEKPRLSRWVDRQRDRWRGSPLWHLRQIQSLKRIHSLGFRGFALTDADLFPLLAHLPNVHKLDLSENHITFDGLVRLSQSVYAPQLEELTLNSNTMDDVRINYTFQGGCFPNLKKLTITHSGLHHLDFLLVGNAFPKLETLELRSNVFQNSELATLLEQPFFRTLRRFAIDFTHGIPGWFFDWLIYEEHGIRHLETADTIPELVLDKLNANKLAPAICSTELLAKRP